MHMGYKAYSGSIKIFCEPLPTDQRHGRPAFRRNKTDTSLVLPPVCLFVVPLVPMSLMTSKPRYQRKTLKHSKHGGNYMTVRWYRKRNLSFKPNPWHLFGDLEKKRGDVLSPMTQPPPRPPFSLQQFTLNRPITSRSFGPLVPIPEFKKRVIYQLIYIYL